MDETKSSLTLDRVIDAITRHLRTHGVRPSTVRLTRADEEALEQTVTADGAEERWGERLVQEIREKGLRGGLPMLFGLAITYDADTFEVGP